MKREYFEQLAERFNEEVTDLTMMDVLTDWKLLSISEPRQPAPEYLGSSDPATHSPDFLDLKTIRFRHHTSQKTTRCPRARRRERDYWLTGRNAQLEMVSES